MAKRCCDTHFYVSGHKTRSGCAEYTAPDGTVLKVVCGRNHPGPGEIHLRDVPDGARVNVIGQAGALSLSLDQSATRGRRGRGQYHLWTELRAQDQHIFAENCRAELPGHAGEGAPWVREVEGILEVAVPGQRVTPRAVRHLVHRIAALDPHDSPREYQTLLRAAVEAVDRTEMPVDARWRLRATLVRNGAATRAGRGAIYELSYRAPRMERLGLARELAACRGVPDAAMARSLGRQMYSSLLKQSLGVLSMSDGIPAPWWVATSILANDDVRELHAEAAQFLSRNVARVAKPDELAAVLRVTARLSTATGLEALRATGLALPEGDAPSPGPPVAQLWDGKVAEMSRRLDEFVALVSPSDPAHDPQTRARALFADHAEPPRPLWWQRDADASFSAAVEACIEVGIGDCARIDRLLESTYLEYEHLATLDGSVSGAITLAQRGVRGDECAQLVAVGLDPYGVPEGAAQSEALYTLLGVPEKLRDELVSNGVQACDYAYFRAASVTDPEDMIERAQHGITAEVCLQLTALGAAGYEEQLRLVQQEPGLAWGLTSFIHAGFTLPEVLQAAEQNMSEFTAWTFDEAFSYSPAEMLQLDKANLGISVVREYRDREIGDVADILALVDADVSPRRAAMYQSAGLHSVQGMAAFKRAGILTAEQVAATLSQSNATKMTRAVL